jgi:hypothetical protein
MGLSLSSTISTLGSFQRQTNRGEPALVRDDVALRPCIRSDPKGTLSRADCDPGSAGAVSHVAPEGKQHDGGVVGEACKASARGAKQTPDQSPNDLQHHFGADATLSREQIAQIHAWLDANAAGHWNTLPSHLFRTPAADGALRITDTSGWRQRHRNIPHTVFIAKPVYRRANCAACQGNASTGHLHRRISRYPKASNRSHANECCNRSQSDVPYCRVGGGALDCSHPRRDRSLRRRFLFVFPPP